VALSIYTLLYHHHHHPSLGLFHLPQGTPYLLWPTRPHLTPACPIPFLQALRQKGARLTGSELQGPQEAKRICNYFLRYCLSPSLLIRTQAIQEKKKQGASQLSLGNNDKAKMLSCTPNYYQSHKYMFGDIHSTNNNWVPTVCQALF